MYVVFVCQVSICLVLLLSDTLVNDTPIDKLTCFLFSPFTKLGVDNPNKHMMIDRH